MSLPYFLRSAACGPAAKTVQGGMADTLLLAIEALAHDGRGIARTPDGVVFVADSLPGIDISTAISFNQFYAWAMSKHAPALRDSVNLWLKKHLK